MARISLPQTLQLALREHVLASDIPDDEEVRLLMSKLTDLNEKLEQIKQSVREKRAKQQLR